MSNVEAANANTNDVSQEDASYKQAVTWISAGRINEAEALLKEIVQERPDYVLAKLALAELMFRRNEFVKASELVKAARDLAPNNADVLTTFGKVQFLTKNYEEAEEAFKKAILIDPTNPQPRINLADLYNLINPGKAKQAYESVLLVDPDNRGAQYAISRYLVQDGELGEAIKMLEKAALEPKNPAPEKLLGDIKYRQGNYSQAEQYYLAALAKLEGFLPAMVSLADLYITQKEYGSATNVLKRAQKVAPTMPDLYFRLGVVSQLQGQEKQARIHYETAIEMDEAYAPAYNNLAWLLYEKRSDIQYALSLAKKANKLEPANVDYQDTLRSLEQL